jgi:flagellar hook-associated protein 2
VTSSSISSTTGTTASTTTAATAVQNYLSSTQESSSQVTGLASGLDTASIISSLMTVAAMPQTNLKNQVTADQSQLTDLQTINTDLTTLQTASEALSQSSGWAITAATSSDTSVTATTSSGTLPGAVTFDVLNVAQAQSVISNDTYSSTTSTVATGNLTFTNSAGKATTIKTGDGSLSSVAAAINAANVGVTASAVKVDATHYRLQVTSNTTGAASAFTLSGVTDDLATLAQGRDATIALGGNSNYTVTSPTNTFTGLTNGLSVTVTKPTTGVTIGVSTDTATLVKNIQAMVDAANATLTEITKDTAYDTTTNTGQPLTGNSTVRGITNSILDSISNSVGGKSLANVGLSLTKDGAVTFDSAAFLSAYAADPSGTQSLFTVSSAVKGLPANTTGGISIRRTSSDTQEGNYKVHITQAASKSTSTADISGGLTAGQVITFGRGSTTASYTVTGNETPAQLAAALTSTSQTAGINLAVTDDGSNLNVSSTGYGAISNFSFSIGGAAQTVNVGNDVAGSINGKAAIGNGQILGAPDLSPPLGGLTLTVSLTAADIANGAADSTVSISAGGAQRFANLASTLTDAQTGGVTNVINGVNTEITSLQTQISDWDTRLADEQASLEQQYANLETMLGTIKSQGSALTSALSSLSSSS